MSLATTSRRPSCRDRRGGRSRSTASGGDSSGVTSRRRNTSLRSGAATSPARQPLGCLGLVVRGRSPASREARGPSAPQCQAGLRVRAAVVLDEEHPRHFVAPDAARQDVGRRQLVAGDALCACRSVAGVGGVRSSRRQLSGDGRLNEQRQHAWAVKQHGGRENGSCNSPGQEEPRRSRWTCAGVPETKGRDMRVCPSRGVCPSLGVCPSRGVCP